MLRNPFLLQIYANVTRRPLSTIGSEQGPALGSAIHAAVAAGAYPDVYSASKAMGKINKNRVRARRGASQELRRAVRDLHRAARPLRPRWQQRAPHPEGHPQRRGLLSEGRRDGVPGAVAPGTARMPAPHKPGTPRIPAVCAEIAERDRLRSGFLGHAADIGVVGDADLVVVVRIRPPHSQRHQTGSRTSMSPSRRGSPPPVRHRPVPRFSLKIRSALGGLLGDHGTFGARVVEVGNGDITARRKRGTETVRLCRPGPRRR